LRRLRAAISAISRSVIVPLSSMARAWSAASETGSAPSGVSVYGSICSVKISAGVPGDDLPDPNARARSMSSCWSRTHAS
jgi:hypothetical protein